VSDVNVSVDVVCPVCHNYHPRDFECLTCKDLRMKAQMKMERSQEHKRCVRCGRPLIHGHCKVCP